LNISSSLVAVAVATVQATLLSVAAVVVLAASGLARTTLSLMVLPSQ
jgi:hypothetical protein